MAQPSKKSTRPPLSVLFDKGRRLFSNKSTQDPPSGLQRTTNVTLSSEPPTKFKKSNDARRDISVLAMTYVLQDNPTIQELIRLVIGLNDLDDGKLSEIVGLSATFTVQLASFHEEDSSKALIAITAFLTTMRDIDIMARSGTETTDNMNDSMNASITQIKNTNPALGHCDRNINGDKGLAGILDTIIGTTSTILNIFNQASVLIPVPFVKPLVASVACLLTAVQQTRSNLDGMRQVATVAGEFVVTLAVACAGDEMKPSRPFQQALDRFENKLHDIAQQCSELSRRNVLWRFFQEGADQNSLSAIKQDLQNAVVQFQTEAQLLQHLDLRSLGQIINGKLDEDAVNALPKPLSYVGRRDEYLAGSRSDVIQVIVEWLDNPNQLTFWMRGGAGLGKSTLGHEIVDSLQADGRLATFSFLLRGSSSDPATIIQTMARELGALHPRAIPQVAMAARTCNASHLPLREYMESYIINPIRSLSYPYPLVIIVDGLDEWEYHEVFLKELEYILPSSPVKILLISRPSYSIERSLLNVAVQNYELPPVSQAIMEQYFNHHFAKIDWEMRKPSPFTISDLARLADGLLIWAAMVCSFLSHKMRAGVPHELVDQILSSGKQIALQGQLSNLYHDALTQLFRDNTDQKLFQRVFGAMTVLRESLPLRDFSRLLGLSHHQVKGVLSQLTALQTRGTLDEDTVPLASQCFHSSFVEFTMNEEAETGTPLIPYLINPLTAHESIAHGCLRFLNDFLSSFRGRECSHSDLRGLELYATKFWPLHVANSNDRLTPLPPKLKNPLLELAENHLRRWGSWFLAINLPASSQDWDQVVGGIDKNGFYSSLADFLGNNMAMNTTLASHRTFCLEVTIRLEPKLEEAWEDLGASYQTRFDSNGTLDLLDNAIVVYRHALELRSKDGSHLTSMSGLASALWNRFQRTGLITDLEETIVMQRELLSLRPTSHPDRSTSLTDLGLGLWGRYRRTGSVTDLEEAILIQRESPSLCPTYHRNRPSSLINLGLALSGRFNMTGSMADLEEATSMLRESLSLCPAPHPLRSLSLTNFAVVLLSRFQKTGSMTDLDEIIAMNRESLSLCPTPHPFRSISLKNLAIGLHVRFEKTGSMTDLDEAIVMNHESLSLHPTHHPFRSNLLNNLGIGLNSRFKETGSITDLEEVISMHRESLSLRPTPHPSRASTLHNLGIALLDRFLETGSMADLEEAISMSRESLSLCPAPHPGRFRPLQLLANALETRFKENGISSDIEEASSLRQEAIALSQ